MQNCKDARCDTNLKQFSQATSDNTVSILRGAGCVYAEEEAALLVAEAKTSVELASMTASRASGLPLEHILGWAEFCGLRIAVGPGVFVPRRRTEFLVHEAVACTPQGGAIVLDLGCGSGALGAAISAQIKDVSLYAADIEPEAVRYARRNLASLGGHVYESDLFESLPGSLRGHIDTIVANMPYVPTDSIEFLPAEARLHEPLVTLDGGADGLALHRRVAAAALSWLAPSGHLLIETSGAQAAAAVKIFRQNGLATRVARNDELEATVIIGAKPAG